MALMSGKVYSNTGAPSNADGVDGDIYLRLDGMKTTYRKESGAWVAVGSTLGAIPEIISGVGAPSNALGADGQYYRDTSIQNIYYKQGGVWNLVGNLTGATFADRLDLAGIGKDLASFPNLINSGSLNAVTTVGEYYYTNAVTDTPSPYGLMKVWRENATYIYQLAQAASGRLHNRYTNDGGTTWTPWFSYISTTDLELATTTALGLVEKATQAEMNAGAVDVWPDAATILNGFFSNSNGYDFPSWLGGLQIRFGEITLTQSEGTYPITFDRPFSTVCNFVTAIYENTGSVATEDLWFQLVSKSKSGAVLYLQAPTAFPSGSRKAFWFAIGK